MAYERARKGSIETTQEVEIRFNFVGRYVPPHFGEVTLTPEEQEALRKKEERKDRRSGGRWKPRNRPSAPRIWQRACSNRR